MQTNYKLLLCSIPEEKEKELRKMIPDFFCVNVEPYQNTVICRIINKAVADENVDFIEQLLKDNFIKQYKTLILSKIAQEELFFPLVEKMLQEEDWKQEELTSILSNIASSYSPSAKILLLKKGAFNLKEESSIRTLLSTAATREFNIELVKSILEYISKYDKLNVFRYTASVSFYIIIETYYETCHVEDEQKKLAILKMLLAVYGNNLFFSTSEFIEHDYNLRCKLLIILEWGGIIPSGIEDERDNILIRWANGEFDK